MNHIDHILTIYQPYINHISTIYQPYINHILTTLKINCLKEITPSIRPIFQLHVPKDLRNLRPAGPRFRRFDRSHGAADARGGEDFSGDLARNYWLIYG